MGDVLHIEMGFYGLLQAYNYTEREKVGQGKKFSDYDCKDGYTYSMHTILIVLYWLWYFIFKH